MKELNNPLLNNQCIKEVISERKYLVLSETEDIPCQYSRYTAKAVFKEKFVAVNDSI